MSTRIVTVYPVPTSWTLEIDEDWETLTEEQRQAYIYEAAVDNGQIGFDYGQPVKIGAVPAMTTDNSSSLVKRR